MKKSYVVPVTDDGFVFLCNPVGPDIAGSGNSEDAPARKIVDARKLYV